MNSKKFQIARCWVLYSKPLNVASESQNVSSKPLNVSSVTPNILLTYIQLPRLHIRAPKYVQESSDRQNTSVTLSSVITAIIIGIRHTHINIYNKVYFTLHLTDTN